MALIVTQRPAKDIEGYTSTWNAINLPIQYKFNSDLFPVNSVDTIYSIISYTNENGLLRVQISGSALNILPGETIKISNSSIETYNGIWKIKTKNADDDYTLGLSFNGAGIGESFQKYYNNYFAEVKVYAGLPSFHPDFADKPEMEVGTLRVTPDINNQIVASFSGIIADNINFEKLLQSGIDINQFTGFYVEFREGYDENISGSIETFFTDWMIDESQNCNVERIVNGNFTTDLSSWLFDDAGIGGGGAWSWDSGSAESTMDSVGRSKIIYQEVNVISNQEYNVNYSVIKNGQNFTSFICLGNDDGAGISWDFIVNFSGVLDDNINYDFVSLNNYKYFGILISGISGNTVNIDSVSFQGIDCTFRFWASNSSLQFQNPRGGNMYDYIAGTPNSRFMSAFKEPVIFDGNYRDDSIILPNLLTIEPNIENIAFMWLNGNDIEGSDTDSISNWVDRTGNVTVTAAPGSKPTVIDSAINGNRGAKFDGTGQFFSTNSNIAQPSIVYAVYRFEDLDSNSIWDSPDAQRSAYFISGFGQASRLFNGAGVLFTPSLTINTDYVLKAVQDGQNSSIIINNELQAFGDAGVNPMINITIGYSEPSTPDTYYNGVICEFIVVPKDIDPCVAWQIETYLGSKYSTYNVSSYAMETNEYDSLGNLLSNDIKDLNFTGDGVYRLQTEKVNVDAVRGDYKIISASDCSISETKSFIYDNECSNQDIYLTWLNSVGGWDYWKFTGEKDYLLNIEDKVTIERNIFNNWDDTFINGDTQLDVLSTTAYNEIDVYSQYLNLDQLQAISQIKYSTKVLMISGDKKVTVIVDSDNITLYNDGDESTLYTIRFRIRFPNIQTQSQ